jgi:hypothetical protein
MPDDRSRTDALAALLIAAGVVWYIASLPHNLGIADEAYLLNDARRIRNGELMYRDIFYFTTPGGHWLLAGLFWLFGTTIGVARLTMAVVHAAIAATTFLLCRRLAVPTPIGLVAAAASVVLCHAAWPYASLHWFSLALMLALAYVAVGRWWTERPPRAAALGLLTGVLMAVQQHKGVVMGLGGVVLIALLAAAERRAGSPAALGGAMRRTLWLASGVAAITVPLLVVLIAQVGVAPLIEQLIVFPFGGYLSLAQTTSWGSVMPLNVSFARYTIPVALEYQPVVLPILAARALALGIRDPNSPRLAPLLGLLAMAGAAALSTAYWADFIHIAFIAPLCFVCWAELVTAAVHRSVSAPARRLAAVSALGTALLAALAMRAAINWSRAWREFPVAHQTAFGRVDFATREEPQLVDRVRGLLSAQGTRDFFAYPMDTSLYLTTGSDNPTRWQLMLPGYVTPEQYESAIASIERRRVPYLFACAVWPQNIDPMLRYIAARYERLDGETHPCALYVRRDRGQHPEVGSPTSSAWPGARARG